MLGLCSICQGGIEKGARPFGCMVADGHDTAASSPRKLLVRHPSVISPGGCPCSFALFGGAAAVLFASFVDYVVLFSAL